MPLKPSPSQHPEGDGDVNTLVRMVFRIWF